MWFDIQPRADRATMTSIVQIACRSDSTTGQISSETRICHIVVSVVGHQDTGCWDGHIIYVNT